VCANCGALLTGEYCSQCGQHVSDVRVSVGVLAHEFVTEHVGVDSKVPRTLWRLIRRPGALTSEYLAGRRARYVLPLKLYLSASLVFFLIMAWQGSGSSTSAKIRITNSDSVALDSLRRAKPNSLEQKLTQRAAERFKGKSPQETASVVVAGFKRYLPNMIFAMLPVFAAILYLLYLRSRRFYAEHLIFAFHFHAFVFVALTVKALAPDALGVVFVLWIFAYLFIAMRRVYGESRKRTAAKYATIVATYMLALFVASFVVLAGVVLVG
jgi:hypothetical protein